MPYPKEVITTLETMAQEVVDPNTPRLKRQEILFAYYQLLFDTFKRLHVLEQQLIDFMYRYPDAVWDQVEFELTEFDLSREEMEVVWSVYREFHRRYRQVQSVARYLERNEEEIVEPPGVILFYFRTGKWPRKDLELDALPFALRLKVNDREDFSGLKGLESDLGSYRDNSPLGKRTFPLILLNLPAIIEGETDEQKVTAHEQTHNLNHIVFNALGEHSLADLIWGGDIEDNTTLSDIFPDGASDEELFQAAKALIPNLLADAKDELIAFASENKDLCEGMEHLKASNGDDTYPFFAKREITAKVFKENGQELLSQLVSEYNQTISRNAGFLQQLFSLYQSEQTLDENLPVLFTFMRYVPLSQWQRIGRRLFCRDLTRMSQHESKKHSQKKNNTE